MTVMIIRPKNHDEWLEVRKTGIGSSEIATIAGLNEYESPYELWERKTGRIPPKEENEAMLEGHLIEDFIAQKFAIATGKTIIKNSAVDWQFRHPKKEWMLASPDRIGWIDDTKKNPRDWKNKFILECKSTNKRVDRDNLSMYWRTQTQWQMGTSTVIDLSFIAWLEKRRWIFDWKEEPFEKDVFKVLDEIGEEFYLKNIKEDIPPLTMYAKDIERMFKQEVAGKVVEADNELVSMLDQYESLKVKADELSEQMSAIKDKVKVAIADGERLQFGERLLATYKKDNDSQTFDSKRFKVEHEDLYNEYLTTKLGSRKLLIK